VLTVGVSTVTIIAAVCAKTVTGADDANPPIRPHLIAARAGRT
jgi:hypothetical protein